MDVGVFCLIFSFIKLVYGKQEGFIVGGTFVENIKQFPHVAFLELLAVIRTKEGDNEGIYICGSSILNQLMLITAAHCLDDVKNVTAYVGNTKRDQGTLCPVKSFEQHRNWDTATIHHDIALCRLKKPLQLGKAVKRVLLLKNPPKTQNAQLAGWGAVDETDYTDTVMLKHTTQKLWSRRQCKAVLKNIPKGTICGGESRSKSFASKGDSGSGLLIKHNIMVGLVSYKDVSISRSLVVYTDVAHYYDWIVNTAKRLTCS